MLCAFVNVNSQESFSIMSYNIRYDNPQDGENSWDKRKFALKSLLQKYNPSIIGLQEVLHGQKEFLTNELNKYSIVGKARDDGNEKGEYSCIMYDTSKYGLLHSHTFWLSEEPNKVSIGWDAVLPRICTYIHLSILGTEKDLHVFNAHFDHKGKLSRINSVELLKGKIIRLLERGESVILLGDFNATELSKEIISLKSFLDDPIEINSVIFNGPAGTYNAFDHAEIPDERIDYIFIKNIEATNYMHIYERRTEKLFISDHFPVYLEFKL